MNNQQKYTLLEAKLRQTDQRTTINVVKNTVKFHIKNILWKFHLANRTALIQKHQAHFSSYFQVAQFLCIFFTLLLLPLQTYFGVCRADNLFLHIPRSLASK